MVNDHCKDTLPLQRLRVYKKLTAVALFLDSK